MLIFFKDQTSPFTVGTLEAKIREKVFLQFCTLRECKNKYAFFHILTVKKGIIRCPVQVL
jgi:hypothetical protein